MTLREKCPNAEFSGPYFPVFALNTAKYGPEKTPYLDSSHSVRCCHLGCEFVFRLFAIKTYRYLSKGTSLM